MKSLFHRSFRAFLTAAVVGGVAGSGAAQSPQLPASPLAGGPAAAAGGQYMDVNGRPIVMPASYGEPCYGGGEQCYGGMGDACGYGGDTGYADFGGYSAPDQCGPHYFDLAVSTVFLTGEDLFQDVLPFGSIGVGGPTILSPDNSFDDYEAGWQIAARYDIGPLSVIEGTYMGIYDIGFSDTVRSVDVAPNGADFQLNSVFSDYGNTPFDGLDEGSIYNLDYHSDLQSTELTYRRYWLDNNPRISGTYLVGFRYLRMTEDLNFNATALLGNSHLLWSTDNDFVGAQFGGDGWISLLQGLRIGGEAKAGIYNNRFKYRHAVSVPDVDVTNINFATDGNQVAFAGESSLDMVADILPSFSLRGGYRVLYMNSLVTVGNNIVPTNISSTALFPQADALYHGFHAGLEYIW